MSVIRLVRLGPPTAKACAAIGAELFAGNDSWPKSAFVAELVAPNNFYTGLIAEADGDEELCGHARITKLGPAGAAEYEIHTVGAGQKWQHRGFGIQLMDALIAAVVEDPDPVFLEVRTDNEPAIAMYRRYGFENMELRKNYYPGSGADVYAMCRPASVG